MTSPRDIGARTLVIDGLANARDLGGLRLSGGGLTPRGVFFRSESADLITPPGWEQARAAGIRTVVDLRQPVERAADTSRRPDWLTTVAVDLDGRHNQEFWRGYWDNGLVGTALYFLPHLAAMPERSGAALSALVTAPPGGVLFHCMGGRDRTGMIAMLLLTAAGAEPAEITEDYMETVRNGGARAAAAGRQDDEPALEAICRAYGSTTREAFRHALEGLNLPAVLAAAGLGPDERQALATWRGTLPPAPMTLR
ncbi:MAG: tyrosine-protein phosphatase [Streptosporangiaceae bacterium]